MKKYLQQISVAIALLAILGCQTNFKLSDSKTKDSQNQNQGPKLTKPVIKKVWVPETIEDDGRVLIEGHYKWLLEKDSSWSR